MCNRNVTRGTGYVARKILLAAARIALWILKVFVKKNA